MSAAEDVANVSVTVERRHREAALAATLPANVLDSYEYWLADPSRDAEFVVSANDVARAIAEAEQRGREAERADPTCQWCGRRDTAYVVCNICDNDD